MARKIFFACLSALLGLVVLGGCKRTGHPAQSTYGYFHTHYQDESQFIVETIVSDIAEQVYYAKFHRLPEAADFFVSATETPGSPFGAPAYDLQIDLDAGHRGLTNRLKIDGPIWAPEVYRELTESLARTAGLASSANAVSPNTDLLVKFTDGLATTIEKQNQNISQALDGDFANPSLHEQAALVLGAFTLREHSGDFFEIRTPLCRLTSHLAMARYLSGNDTLSLNGRIAGVILQTLMNRQAEALKELSGIQTNNATLISWARALSVRNNGDYRPLDRLDGLSQLECSEWFYALDRSANTDIAWGKLSDSQKSTVDFARIANEGGYSVGVGHELLALSLPLEFKEIAAVYSLSHGEELGKDGLVRALNELPGRCFSAGRNKKTGVHVIGWGLWAGFLQRQLCHAVQQNFHFMQEKWSVPDDAKEFSIKCDHQLAGLWMYPFVRRFNATDATTYHQAVDDGFKVTVATPQLVPVKCWNYLCFDLSPGMSYQPNPNPHVNEWHKHNPPPGTAYNVMPRFNHPSLIGRADSMALISQLHDLAPFDSDLAWYIWKNKYNAHPTYQQASELFQPILAYNTFAMELVAKTVKNQPEKYEQLLAKAAEVDPSDYFVLSSFFEGLNDAKAANYAEQGRKSDPDDVEVANEVNWLMHYYLKNSRVNDARQLADFAGDVYSFSGLETKSQFLEQTGDYNGAFEWLAKLEERYDDSGPLVGFCVAYKAKTGDSRFDSEVKKRMGKLFPKGIEQVKLADFQSAPTEGVIFRGENDLLRAAGLHMHDVIVAVYGVRVQNMVQYNYQICASPDPGLDLIVWRWREKRFDEIKASPPNHRFGVEIGTYPK